MIIPLVAQVGFGDGQEPSIDPLLVTWTVALVTITGLGVFALILVVVRYRNRSRDADDRS